MNPVTRFLTGLGIAAALVLSFFFFATVGLVLLGIVGIILLISYIKRGGRKQTTSGFQVFTIRTDDSGTVFHRETISFDALGNAGQSSSSGKNSGDDIVDISPEEYKEISSSEDIKSDHGIQHKS